MRSLQLAVNDINDAGIAAIGAALGCQNNSLRVLCLYANNCTERGARALADALRCNSTLAELNLNGNFLRDAGATTLCDALRRNGSSVEKLLANGNEFTASGIAQLSSVFSLTDLDIRNNRECGVDGVSALAAALSESRCRMRCLGLR